MLPPPKAPRDTGNADDWARIETELDVSLPADYREFIGRYGTGCIDDFFWVLNPFSRLPTLDLRIKGERLLEAMRYLKAECGDEEVPYPVFPEIGGLFPWGLTDNGDMLFWITDGSPSRWPVTVNEGRGAIWEKYDYSMVVFLRKLLSKQIRSEILPEDFPSDSPSFRVISEVRREA